MLKFVNEPAIVATLVFSIGIHVLAPKYMQAIGRRESIRSSLIATAISLAAAVTFCYPHYIFWGVVAVLAVAVLSLCFAFFLEN